MNGNGSLYHPEFDDNENIRSLSEITWEMPLPLTLSWGTVRAKGTASIQVRNPERLEALGSYDAQVAAIQALITQSLEDIVIALLPSSDQLPTHIWQIASATLVSVNSKLYDYGAVLLDLSISEIAVFP